MVIAACPSSVESPEEFHLQASACVPADCSPNEPAEVVIDEDTNAAMWAELDQLQAEAGRLVAQHWRAIQRVAKTLERRDRIDQAELDRLIAISERQVAA